MFEKVSLVAPFTAGELTEALTLFRDVEIITNSNRELLDLIGWFTPGVLVSFLEEFHEQVRLKCYNYNVAYRAARGKWTSVRWGYPEDLVGDSSELDFMRKAGGLEYLTGTDRPSLKLWQEAGAVQVLSRIESADMPEEQDQYMMAFFGEEDLLTLRFRFYLKACGVADEAVKVWIDGPSYDYSIVFPRIERHGHPDPELDEHFVKFVQESMTTYVATNASSSDLVVPYRGSGILSYDISRLLRSHQTSAERDAFVSVAVPDIPWIDATVPNSAGGISHVAKELVAARRARLAVPASSDGDVYTVIRALSTRPWLSTLPTKTARFAVFTGTGLTLDMFGAGGIGTAIGAGLGALDSFLLDRILKRWRPNQYLLGHREALDRLARRAAATQI